MRPRFRAPRPALLVAGLAGFIAPIHLVAQASPAEAKVRWSLGTSSGAWCVHFLVSPADAEQHLPRGYRPIPAAETVGIPPALARTTSDEPEYAGWIPARACVVLLAGVGIGDRQYGRGDGGKELALFWWGVSAAGDHLAPESGGLALRQLATNSSGLKRQMELELVRMERIDIDKGPIKESEDERTRVRFNDSELAFDGHPRADSTLKLGPIHEVGAMSGDGNRVWVFDLSMQPATIAGMSGALRFQGRDDLTKLLARSPIRLLGSLTSGGTGEALIRP
jgi:hypothetical protein